MMEHTKKMVLIDPRMLSSLKNDNPIVNPEISSLKRLDKEMSDVLHRDDIDVREKAKIYQQVLWKYMNRYDNAVNAPVSITRTSPPSEKIIDDVVDSVPISLKRKAERLMRHIRNHSVVDWNDKGEINFKGQTISNSNLIDLVNDVLRKRRGFNPKGWDLFASALRESNVPQDLIGHPDRWSYISEDQIPKSTPRRKRVRNLDWEDY